MIITTAKMAFDLASAGITVDYKATDMEHVNRFEVISTEQGTFMFPLIDSISGGTKRSSHPIIYCSGKLTTANFTVIPEGPKMETFYMGAKGSHVIMGWIK